jgi:hypothetical protein
MNCMAYILAATRSAGLTRVNHPGKKYETQFNWTKDKETNREDT